MKTSLSLFVLVLAVNSLYSQVANVLSFENFGLPLDTVLRADPAHQDTFFNAGDVLIPSVFDTSFGGYWAGGWSISTSRNDSVGDFTNLEGSITGGGNGGSNTYLVGQNFAYLLLPPNATFNHVAFTNTTYTAHAVEDGSLFSRPFGIDSLGNSGFPDSLLLRLEVYLNNSLVDVIQGALADYRYSDDGDDYVLQGWDTLRSLSNALVYADSLSFSMVSSDRSIFGNNTPDFFVLDDLGFSISVSGTESLVAQQPLEAFPNPVFSEVTLGVSGEFCRVFISNSSGQVVHVNPDFRLGDQLDLSELKAGLYYAIAQNKSGSRAVKLIKQ